MNEKWVVRAERWEQENAINFQKDFSMGNQCLTCILRYKVCDFRLESLFPTLLKGSYTSPTIFEVVDFYISVSSRYMPLHSSTYYTIFIIIQCKCWFLVGFSCVPAPLIALSSAFTFIHSIFLILSLVSKVWELHHLTSVQPNLYTYTHTALFLMLCHPFGRSSNNNNSTLLLLLRVGMRSFVIWSSFYVTSPAAAFKLQGVQTRNV